MIFLAIDLTFLIFSVIVFFTILAVLAGGLLYAKTKLVSDEDVVLTLNGGKQLTVKPGSSLLTVLSNEGIFLPSACGGGGTCAMCKCHIPEGGGDTLPTEMNHFTRKQAQEKMRLACQVKVKNDMTVEIPEEVFGIKKWECEVTSNFNVATFH
jgi:Na+-transporting NADH:ubiquinone oxidoreductase subunit F